MQKLDLKVQELLTQANGLNTAMKALEIAFKIQTKSNKVVIISMKIQLNNVIIILQLIMLKVLLITILIQS